MSSHRLGLAMLSLGRKDEQFSSTSFIKDECSGPTHYLETVSFILLHGELNFNIGTLKCLAYICLS